MMESFPVLPLESVAVTVTVFAPTLSPMAVVVQGFTPLALPLVGVQVEQAQATELTNTLSEELP